MNLKKTRILAIFITFAIGFLCHFAYDLMPNFITSLLFPVNESVWEHMKILYTSILIYGIIDYFILKKFNIEHNNFLISLFITSFISVIIYLALFIPIYYSVGESMFISISLLFITYMLVYIINYHILKTYNLKIYKISILPILIGYVIFGFLTYYPIKTQLFFDTKDEIYGIKEKI